MKYTDQQGIAREIDHSEMDDVYHAIGVLTELLRVEHVAEYFKHPMHDDDTYASFKGGVDMLRILLSHVAEVPSKF